MKAEWIQELPIAYFHELHASKHCASSLESLAYDKQQEEVQDSLPMVEITYSLAVEKACITHENWRGICLALLVPANSAFGLAPDRQPKRSQPKQGSPCSILVDSVVWLAQNSSGSRQLFEFHST